MDRQTVNRSLIGFWFYTKRDYVDILFSTEEWKGVKNIYPAFHFRSAPQFLFYYELALSMHIVYGPRPYCPLPSFEVVLWKYHPLQVMSVVQNFRERYGSGHWAAACQSIWAFFKPSHDKSLCPSLRLSRLGEVTLNRASLYLGQYPICPPRLKKTSLFTFLGFLLHTDMSFMKWLA